MPLHNAGMSLVGKQRIFLNLIYLLPFERLPYCKYISKLYEGHQTKEEKEKPE